MKGKWPAKMTKKGEGVIKEIVFDDDARRCVAGLIVIHHSSHDLTRFDGAVCILCLESI